MINFTVETKKLGRQVVTVDEEDLVRMEKYSWTLWTSERHYGIYVIGYLKGDSYIRIRLHRLIMNAKVGEIVDHIDGNPLNNQKSNLRITTSLVNNQNARKRKDGRTSTYKGVSWYPQTNKWKAQIQMNGKRISLGYHKTEVEAAAAYIKFCNDNNISFRV